MTHSSPLSVAAKLARCLVGALVFLCVSAAWADGVGVVTHLTGVLTAQNKAGASRILAPKSEVNRGDTLVSEDKTFARIKFSDGGNLVIRPKSRVTIDQYNFKPDNPGEDGVSINLIKGGLRSITGIVGKRSKDRHSTTTANATIGIRGTHFGLQLCLEDNDCDGLKTLSGAPLSFGLHIDVLEGTVFAKNTAGTQDVSAGQFGYVKDPQTKPVLVPSEEGSRATVPPSMVSDTGDGMTVGRESNDNKCATK